MFTQDNYFIFSVNIFNCCCEFLNFANNTSFITTKVFSRGDKKRRENCGGNFVRLKTFQMSLKELAYCVVKNTKRQ